MITQTYKLGIIPKFIIPYVMVSQYDTARQIELELYENGVVYSPSGTAKVTINETEISATLNGNVVSFVVPEELTQEVDTYYGEVTITDNGVMSSCNFKFIVDPTPIETTSGDTETIRALSVLLGRTLKSNIATPSEELKTILGE